MSVSVEKSLAVPPDAARRAFLSYTWQRGGDLPVLVLPRGPAGDRDGGIAPRRLLLPLFAEEALVGGDAGGAVSAASDADPDGGDCRVRYALTELGPVWRGEIEAGSHLGTVRFTRDPPSDGEAGGCTMTWSCTFTALQRRGLWEQVTRYNIATACDNLAAYVAPPLRYVRRTRLRGAGVTPAAAARAWRRFVWAEGGGLPAPPPIVLGGGGRDILRVPPFLRESIVSVAEGEGGVGDECEIRYKVVNPGLLTYQVHTHEGRVRFVPVPGGDGVEMRWEVKIRPMDKWGPFVKGFTSGVVSTLARNLKVHLEEGPEAVVSLSPPRGAGKPFGSVRKDSWLGGVLAAHLADQRSAWEQTVSMFQPWSWGRSTDEEGEGAEWTVAAE